MLAGHTTGVMAGLVPAIHVFTATPRGKDVDARDKRGHDAAGTSMRMIAGLLN